MLVVSFVHFGHPFNTLGAEVSEVSQLDNTLQLFTTIGKNGFLTGT